MKNFIKGFRFTPSNYPAAVEDKIQKYRKQGYKLPPRKVLRTPEQHCIIGSYRGEYPWGNVYRGN